MTEQKPKDNMGELVKFVDDNVKTTSIIDIFNVFPQLFIVLLFLAVALYAAIRTLPTILSSEWTPVLIFFVAIFIALYSFTMASRKYVNKRLANREANRIGALFADKSNQTVCLLKPLVALKLEYIKLNWKFSTK